MTLLVSLLAGQLPPAERDAWSRLVVVLVSAEDAGDARIVSIAARVEDELRAAGFDVVRERGVARDAVPRRLELIRRAGTHRTRAAMRVARDRGGCVVQAWAASADSGKVRERRVVLGDDGDDDEERRVAVEAVALLEAALLDVSLPAGSADEPQEPEQPPEPAMRLFPPSGPPPVAPDPSPPSNWGLGGGVRSSAGTGGVRGVFGPLLEVRRTGERLRLGVEMSFEMFGGAVAIEDAAASLDRFAAQAAVAYLVPLVPGLDATLGIAAGVTRLRLVGEAAAPLENRVVHSDVATLGLGAGLERQIAESWVFGLNVRVETWLPRTTIVLGERRAATVGAQVLSIDVRVGWALPGG